MTKTVSMPGGWPSCVIVFNEDKVPTQFQLKKLEGGREDSKEVTFVLKAGVAIELFKKALKAAESPYDYPLGDEIAAFLDWFKHRTEELIAQWNCGTYGIKEDGLR